MSYSWNYDYPQIARDSGFKLQQFQEGSINWRAVGSVEVGRIVSEQNLEQIDGLLDYLSEAPLVPLLKSNILESGLCKFFGLAQLGVQYLLFCKKFLDKTVAGLREALRENQSENHKLKSQNNEINKEFLRLHQKLERLEEINKVLYPCPTCPKNFVSSEMLKTHIARKHSQVQTKSTEASDRTLINTIKLELEIKQLKERLNAAEKQIKENNVPSKEERATSPPPRVVVNEVKEFKTTSVQTEVIATNVGIQTNLSDDKDFDEIADREIRKNQELLHEIKGKFSDIEKWKVQETELSKKFMEAVMEKLQTRKSTDGNVSIEKDIEPAIANAIRNVDDIYMDKLNGIANKIEGSLRLTFCDLQEELQQLCKTQEKVESTVENLLKERNLQNIRNSSKELELINRYSEIRKPVVHSTQTEVLVVNEKKFDPQPGPATDKTAIVTEKKTLAENFDPDIRLVPSPAMRSNPKPIPEQRLNQKKEMKSHRQSKEKHDEIDINAQLNARLSDLGISPSADSIPTNFASYALQLMTKNHNSKKSSNFVRVRNRIKTVVDRLSREKVFNEIEDISHAPFEENFQQRDAPERLDDFKIRLEKILSTPIEKASKSIYSGPSSSSNHPLQDSSAQRKPVPVPRKRVVFDLERIGMRSPPSD